MDGPIDIATSLVVGCAPRCSGRLTAWSPTLPDRRCRWRWGTPRPPCATRWWVEQEIYALLVTYQALRIAKTDATLRCPDVDSDRASFTIALHAARDQLVQAAGVIEDTVIDLVGVIGNHVLAHLMPTRRSRTNPRVVKRAISKFVASSARGRTRGPSRKATITINTLPSGDP